MSGIVDKLLENAKIVNKNINIMKETIERHSPRDIDLECNIDNKGNLINSDISDSITIQILKSKQLIGVKGGSIPKINKLNYEAILNFKNSLCVLEKCHLKEDFDNFYYSLLNDLKVVKKNCEYLKKAFPESEKSVIRTGFGIDSYIGGITELEKGVPFWIELSRAEKTANYDRELVKNMDKKLTERAKINFTNSFYLFKKQTSLSA